MATMNELLKNEEFLKGLVDVQTPEALGELLKANDVELEEGITLEKAFEIIKSQKDAELSEADLEDANGGIAFGLAVASVGCFVASGAALSFLGGYAYQSYKRWKRR